MKFMKEALFCRDLPLFQEKSQTKIIMQTRGKQRDTIFIFSKKQGTNFSPPTEKSWLKNICEMAVQHINFLACSRKKDIVKPYLWFYTVVYTTDIKYFQKVAQHQGHSSSIPLQLSQTLCHWWMPLKNVKPAIYVTPPKLHWVSIVGKFRPKNRAKPATSRDLAGSWENNISSRRSWDKKPGFFKIESSPREGKEVSLENFLIKLQNTSQVVIYTVCQLLPFLQMLQ